MAKIGDLLTKPEAGWKRIEEDNANFVYTDGVYTKWISDINTLYSNNKCMHNDNSSTAIKNSYLMKVKFIVKTDKLRIIAFSRDYCTNNIQIKIDGVNYTYSLREYDKANQTLVFEKTDLSFEKHIIEITDLLDSTTNNFMYFDAIDIDENGDILQYTETNCEFLLKQDTKYYTIKDNSLVLLASQTLDENNFNTNGFEDLNLLTQNNESYNITKKSNNNIFEFDLNNDMKKIEVM